MFERAALKTALAASGLDLETLAQSHPTLFSQSAVSISPAALQTMADLVVAVESVVALPAYQARVLAWGPVSARRPQVTRSVFFGYDFHLSAAGPRLIEINTNAGGGLLSSKLLWAHGERAAVERIEQEFVAMFREEWRLARGDAPLRRIAIVDENPEAQYLAPEFELFRRLFEGHGMAAVIADPRELAWDGQALSCRGAEIDLIYNRLTDFSLEAAANASLLAAFTADRVVVTPHPRAHALYADKRNLILLSDPLVLAEFGVPAATQEILLAGIPRTVAVSAAEAEQFWNGRKGWFFKPATGFGSRAAYRGDKLTKRVFEEIMQGGYIAQQIVPPSELVVVFDEVEQRMKLDVRCYAYAARVQMVAARLYQGQTTNFRTAGGGFAPVFAA